MDDFEQELKLEALDEVEDHLNRLTEILNELELKQAAQAHLDEMFRIFHSIKGVTASTGFKDLSSVTHQYEDLFSKFKSGEMAYDRYANKVMSVYISQVGAAVGTYRGNVEAGVDFSMALEELHKLAQGTHAQEGIDADFLMVDDEKDIVDMLVDEVQGHFGLRGLKAHDGEEGRRLADEREFDFIITDFKMPLKNGEELVSDIRLGGGPNAKTPIIMLTAYRPGLNSSPEIWENVFFLDKPVGMESLQYMVKCCLGLKKKTA